MNHEQWEALQAAAKGHKQNPLGDCAPEGLACVVFCSGWTDADVALAAAAPDLLAEVERLRDLLARLREMVDPDSDLACAIDAALDGAEVPE